MTPLLGDAYSHQVLALDNDFSASSHIDPRYEVGRIAPPPVKDSLRAPFHLRRIIAQAAPDLVLTYNWGAMDAVMAMTLLPTVPVIHTEDGFHPDEAVRLHWRRRTMRRILLNRVYQTVVPSHTLLCIAREQFLLRPDKVRLIPNGIDTGRFMPGRNFALRRQWGVSNDDVVFGTVGKLRAEKNLGWMMDAFRAASLDNARLVIVGDGPCEAEWRKHVAEAGLESQVIFAGATSDTASFYRGFDVFLMSSVTEQMPMALLEAMSSGLPTLCTAAGDTAMMLEGGGVPPVAIGDMSAYVGQLRQLALDSAWRESFSQTNRRIVVAQYSAERMVESYRELYTSAIQQRHTA